MAHAQVKKFREINLLFILSQGESLCNYERDQLNIHTDDSFIDFRYYNAYLQLL